MKRYIPLLIVLLAGAWVGASWLPPRQNQGDFDLSGLGKVPVLVGGRVKPLDTVARNSLLIIHGKQNVALTNGGHVTGMRWLADVLFNGPVADQYPLFVINNAEVLGLFGWEQGDRKYFSFAELSPFLKQIDEQGEQAGKLQSVQRSAYQNAVLNLRNSVVLYQRLKNSLQPEETTAFANEVDLFEKTLPAARNAAKQSTLDPSARTELLTVAQAIQRYEGLAGMAYILAIPPRAPATKGSSDWHSVADSLLHSIAAGSVDPVVKSYARLSDAYRSADTAGFNQQVADLTNFILKEQPVAAKRASFEFLFNRVEPFYHDMILYVLAFLLACTSWLAWNRVLNRSAFYLLLLALAVHTFGLVARMYLQERPPVTNLYSSAIFIGWGTVVVGLILERIFRDGIGSACAGAIGFITLVIAHHLAGSGDTLEMLQAVLDTNIWLATHVVAITTGYAAMFLAGMLAIIYVVRGVFTRSLTRPVADAFGRMTYGVICFATLFSFVGTVLGGIWADQSWGRFWGWDPKENGAVLIVLWCAITLHARWGGFIRQRGLMMMALFGNVITSFSWFGVNMLGVGLHSYGFMQKAFPWLVGFVVSQLALITIAAMPLQKWKSFQTVGGEARKPVDVSEGVSVAPG
jgi:ABC-type transport system involved in cytochrome c biogenesis permease subunit